MKENLFKLKGDYEISYIKKENDSNRTDTSSKLSEEKDKINVDKYYFLVETKDDKKIRFKLNKIQDSIENTMVGFKNIKISNDISKTEIKRAK